MGTGSRCANPRASSGSRVSSRAFAALQPSASETKPSFACRRSLPTENPKAAIAHDAEIVFIQLTATPRLPQCRASPQASLFG